MAEFDDMLKLAAKLSATVDDFDEAQVGDEVEIPEIRVRIGKARWRIPAHKAIRDK